MDFFIEDFNESPWKLKSYAQQDLKWHGGIKECCVHVGKTHTLETPIINWKQSPLLLGRDPIRATKDAEWSR